MMKAFIGSQSAMREKTSELAVKDEVIRQLHHQIEVDNILIYFHVYMPDHYTIKFLKHVENIQWRQLIN